MSEAKATTKAAPKAKSGEKKTKVAPTHPKYLDMAWTALNELKERGGSSRQAIVKYITSKFPVDAKSVNKHVKQALKKGVETGTIKHVKGQGASGSFKAIPKKVVKKPKKVQKKTKVAKKKTVKKAVKKAAPKKVEGSPKKSAAKPKKAAPAKPKKAAVAAKPKKEKPTKEKKAKKPAKKASPAKAKKASK